VLTKGIQMIKEKTLIYASNGTINIDANSFFFIKENSASLLPTQIKIIGSTSTNYWMIFEINTTSNYATIQLETILLTLLYINP
jgi:hypothetical protein